MKIQSTVSLITNSSSVLFASAQATTTQTMQIMREIVSDNYHLFEAFMPFCSSYYYDELFPEDVKFILEKYGNNDLDFVWNYRLEHGYFPDIEDVQELFNDEEYYEGYYSPVFWYLVVSNDGKLNKDLTNKFNNIFTGVEVGEG